MLNENKAKKRTFKCVLFYKTDKITEQINRV